MEEEVGDDVGFSGIAGWLAPFRGGFHGTDMAPGSHSDVRRDGVAVTTDRAEDRRAWHLS